MRRTLRFLAAAWLQCGIAALILLLAEASAGVLFDRIIERIYRGEKAAACAVQAQGGADWARGYFEELNVKRAWRLRFCDYVMSRHRETRGRYLNIGADGLRATVNPPAPPGTRRAAVWMFGGSTAWGHGNPDDRTIASLLAKRLDEAGYPAQVTNYGEWSFVGPQEAVDLIGQLTAGGGRPDIVIFFDGLNEVQEPAILGRDTDVTEFSLQVDPLRPRPVGRHLRDLARSSKLYQLAYGIGAERGRCPGLEPSETRTMASSIAARYVRTTRVVEALGRRFGFRPLFYWQPVLAGKPVLSELERRELAVPFNADAACDVKDQALFSQTLGGVRSALEGRPDFRDIHDLFARDAGTVFTDGVHYTAAADDRIAGVMAADAARLLGSSRRR